MAFRVPVKTPKVGDIAHHKGGLDSRPIADVDVEHSLIKLQIGSALTDWVPMKNYTYTTDGSEPRA